jgi:excisionase family DNA binding protein
MMTALRTIPARYGSAAEAARYTGLSPKTIRRWVAAGVVPGYRVGRRVLIRFADLDRHIQEQRRRTPLMATAPPTDPPVVDPTTGRRRDLSAEERRAWSESLRRALEANAAIADETDAEEVWDRVERMLGAERP